MVKGEGPDLGPYHELLALNYSHGEYHEVTLYERFKATLVRDLLANDGVTVTGEEEKEIEGLVVEKAEILAPELEDRWRVRDEEELDPYQGYRWEVSFGGSIDYNTTGSDANGEALEVNGRTSPSSDASLLETLASEHEIKSLYEQVGSPPDPSVYWTGSVGDMGFGAAPWSSSERTEEGGNTNSPTPSELESYADFVSGVTPSVKWSEYWGQTDAPVPADGGPAKSTVVFFAKSINEDGETTSTGTVTVTFTIDPGQRVSTDTPVIESSSGSMGSWIVAQSDGTVRAEPPVERGKRNVVDLLPVDLYSDLNNDGEIDSADSGLVGKPYESGASEAEKDKGTEFMFANDNLSNGAWDKEDTTTEGKPADADDDDAEAIFVGIGSLPDQTEVWLEHPASAGLKFYRDRKCTDEIPLSSGQRHVVDGPVAWPDDNIVFVRAESVNFPDAANPQVEGDLKLMVKIGSQEIEATKMKLTIIKELGAKKYLALR
jgi:hypothetical protein